MPEVLTKSSVETKKVAAFLARSLKKGVVIAMEGNLGSGKTTFVQGFAKALGIRENVLSPTFVLMKIYPLSKKKKLKHLIHIDCYRLGSPSDLRHLGFRNLLKDKDAIILIEWADRIKKLIPLKNVIWIKFSHGKSPMTRIIRLRIGEKDIKNATEGEPRG